MDVEMIKFVESFSKIDEMRVNYNNCFKYCVCKRYIQLIEKFVNL